MDKLHFWQIDNDAVRSPVITVRLAVAFERCCDEKKNAEVGRNVRVSPATYT
jgi:hypothetical protein